MIVPTVINTDSMMSDVHEAHIFYDVTRLTHCDLGQVIGNLHALREKIEKNAAYEGGEILNVRRETGYRIYGFNADFHADEIARSFVSEALLMLGAHGVPVFAVVAQNARRSGRNMDALFYEIVSSHAKGEAYRPKARIAARVERLTNEN